MDHDCCGIAGTYGLEEREVRHRDGGRRAALRRIRASGAPEAACDSETCRWQIAAATGARMRHPVEILAEAYRRADAASSDAAAAS